MYNYNYTSSLHSSWSVCSCAHSLWSVLLSLILLCRISSTSWWSRELSIPRRTTWMRSSWWLRVPHPLSPRIGCRSTLIDWTKSSLRTRCSQLASCLMMALPTAAQPKCIIMTHIIGENNYWLLIFILCYSYTILACTPLVEWAIFNWTLWLGSQLKRGFSIMLCTLHGFILWSVSSVPVIILWTPAHAHTYKHSLCFLALVIW